MSQKIANANLNVMSSLPVLPTPKCNDNPHNAKIGLAIDLLLSSDSVEISEPTIRLTQCSTDIDVIMNKQGGICTNCGTLFKSGPSLINHVAACNPSSRTLKIDDDCGCGDSSEDTVDMENNTNSVSNSPISTPKLVIVSNK